MKGADEVFGGYHWYPHMMRANDAVDEYARIISTEIWINLTACHPKRVRSTRLFLLTQTALTLLR